MPTWPDDGSRQTERRGKSVGRFFQPCLFMGIEPWTLAGFDGGFPLRTDKKATDSTMNRQPGLTKKDVKPIKTNVMRQGTMNILFFVLKTKLLKNGEVPILMRVTINGQYDEVRIQRSVPLKQWNAAKGRSTGKGREANELNEHLTELHSLALQKHKELMLEQAYITPRLILKRVFGKDTELRTLLNTMQEEIENMRKVVNIDYSPITINRYVNVLNKLKAAVPRFYGKEDITFFELTTDFIKSFDTFLKTEAGLCRNTIIRYMKCLKRIVNMALAKDVQPKNEQLPQRNSRPVRNKQELDNPYGKT